MNVQKQFKELQKTYTYLDVDELKALLSVYKNQIIRRGTPELINEIETVSEQLNIMLDKVTLINMVQAEIIKKLEKR